jgi:RHS repeat-associated protein
MHKYCATPRTSARRRHRACVLKCTRNATSNRLLSFDQTLTTTTANVSYQYDANGSLLKDGLRSYEYDAANRLADATTGAGIDAPTTRYVHNALGQRLFKTEPLYAPVASGSNPADPGVMAALVSFFTSLWGGNTTTVAPSAAEKLGYSYFYDEDGSLLYELGAGGANSTGSAHYVYLPTPNGPMPIGYYNGSKHYAVHTDHLNTPRRLTQSNKQVAWQWAFSAFGDEQPTLGKNRYVDPTTIPNAGSTTIADVTFNLRYPGQYFDKESNLHFNWMRSYSPNNGRYTQADPIDLAGGWNRYGYVEGNPLSFVDPEGLQGRGTVTPGGPGANLRWPSIGTVGQQTHQHHSGPVFMGFPQNQQTTPLVRNIHEQLHRELNSFLRTQTNEFGQHMRPQSNNSCVAIRENFSQQDRFNAMREFYNRYGEQFPQAARDFFRQFPEQNFCSR